MVKINRRFGHSLEVFVLAPKCKAEIKKKAREYGLEFTELSDVEFQVEGKGADVTAKVTATKIIVKGDLSFPASLVSGRIEDGIEETVLNLIEKCSK